MRCEYGRAADALEDLEQIRKELAAAEELHDS
jgi:hypothetical protein